MLLVALLGPLLFLAQPARGARPSPNRPPAVAGQAGSPPARVSPADRPVDAGSAPETGVSPTIEQLLKWITLLLAHLAEMCGAAVIGIGTLRGMITYILSLFRAEGGIVPKEAIRLSLGRSLALALEFETGADILKTAVAPSWNDIGQLAAIIVLRTALNYFLQQELERAAPEERAAARSTAGARRSPA